MQLFVKTLTGQTVTPRGGISLHTTIAQVKLRLQDKLGVPPAGQRLLFGSKQLSDDNRTLEQYGVEKESTLCLIARLNKVNSDVASSTDAPSSSAAEASSTSSTLKATVSPKSKAAAKCKSGRRAQRQHDATTHPDVERKLREQLAGTMIEGAKSVQILFVFDTTGSMYSVLKEVRKKVKESCERLIKDIENIEIGIMAMGTTYTQREDAHVF